MKLVHLSSYFLQHFFGKTWFVTSSEELDHKILLLMKHFFYLDQTHLTYEQLDEFVTQNSSRDEISNKLVCHICSTTATTRQNMENHIEARHCVLPPLLCSICNKQAKTRNSLAKHMGTYHKWSMINRRFCVIV